MEYYIKERNWKQILEFIKQKKLFLSANVLSISVIKILIIDSLKNRKKYVYL